MSGSSPHRGRKGLSPLPTRRRRGSGRDSPRDSEDPPRTPERQVRRGPPPTPGAPARPLVGLAAGAAAGGGPAAGQFFHPDGRPLRILVPPPAPSLERCERVNEAPPYHMHTLRQLSRVRLERDRLRRELAARDRDLEASERDLRARQDRLDAREDDLQARELAVQAREEALAAAAAAAPAAAGPDPEPRAPRAPPAPRRVHGSDAPVPGLTTSRRTRIPGPIHEPDRATPRRRGGERRASTPDVRPRAQEAPGAPARERRHDEDRRAEAGNARRQLFD